MGWFLAAAAACACFCASALGTLVPLRAGPDVEYLFVWPGWARFGVSFAVALATLTALCVAARRRPGRWLAPLLALACAPLGMLAAVPGVGKIGAPTSYLFYDMRWWWAAALIAWTIVRARGSSAQSARKGLTHTRSRFRGSGLYGLTVAAVAVFWAIATSPNVRFGGDLNGDEPKYVRYCEVWYQGGGCDISQKVPFSKLPPGMPPRVPRAAWGVVRASFEEARQLAIDLRDFAAHPLAFRWNRASGSDGFVRGKRGGMYEIYQPGVSALLFPGFIVDHMRAARGNFNDELPGSLPATGLMMLLVYAGCAVASFALFRHALVDGRVAWLAAAALMVTLPMSAFAFQFYPEAPAALLVTTVLCSVLFADSGTTPRRAILAGLGAGALAWLHPRFLLVSACLATIGVWKLRSKNRRLYLAAWGFVLLTVMAYDYRVTGSWMPTALWAAGGPPDPLSLSAMRLNLLAYAFDRRWGLLAHAPILLALVPGLVLLARRAPDQAVWLVVLALSLSAPAAAHTLDAAGSTPGRLLLGIVPLAAWPIALVARETWRVPACRVATVALIVISVHTAFVYDWYHRKQTGTLRDRNFSGWEPNLAFPGIRDDAWSASQANFVLLIVLIAAIALLSWMAWRFAARAQPTVRPGGSVPAWLPPATVLAIAAASTLATTVNGNWYYDDYMIDEGSARRLAAEALVDRSRCALCFSSSSVSYDWTRLQPNGAREVQTSAAVAGRTATIHVHVDAPEHVLAFGRTRVEFGDGAAVSWSGIVGDRAFAHEYARPGAYTATTWLQMRDGSLRTARADVLVK